MRFSLLLLAGLLPTLAAAQTTPGFERLPSGIEYQLFRRDAAGRYQRRPLVVPTDSAYATRQGRFLLGHVTVLTGRDSVLQSSRQQLHNHPVPLPLTPLTAKGGQDEALSLVLPGDSGVFRFAADSILKGRPVPPELKRGGNVLVMRIVGLKLIKEAQAMALQQELQQTMMAEQRRQAEAHAAGQTTKDNAEIAAYLKKNNLTAKAKKTPGGTWYYLTQTGSGPLPQAGQPVQVKYRGSVLATGKEFDSSDKHGGTPFEFTLGRGQVIPGWDQAIALLPKGSKAVLLIPSPLAYGERGAGADIPPNAVLRFEVELPGAPAKPLDWVNKKMSQGTPAKKPVVKKALPAKK